MPSTVEDADMKSHVKEDSTKVTSTKVKRINGLDTMSGANGFVKETSTKEDDMAGEQALGPEWFQRLVETTSCSLSFLYTSSVVAKIWGVALRELYQENPPTTMPEYIEPGGERYVNSRANFWTSGFFPGSLYILRERQLKYPNLFGTSLHPLKLRYASKWWAASLHKQAARTDTHDLGFLIQPWAQLGWDLDQDTECYNTLVTAANALASRFDERVGCIRSWDTCFTKRYSYGDPSKDFLVIIDNMMNLDLLYRVADMTRNRRLSTIATKHALRTLTSHIRGDDSTCHVVNFEQEDGSVKERMTNQGFSDDSCWARGQAWGITGYAQAYRWTREPRFLEASIRLAKYFVDHLPEDNVPYWDFGAPLPGPRDTSAALIAAYGMLLLHQICKDQDKIHARTWLDMALRITKGVAEASLAPEARFVTTSRGEEDVDFGGPETIVLNATINNYEFAPRRWADHGLVYADYYFLLIGNELLKMGIVV